MKCSGSTSRLRKLAIFTGVAVLVLAAFPALLLYFDGQRIQASVSNWLTERYGLTLDAAQVDRTFDVRPHIRVRGLQVANAQHGDEPLVSIDEASFRVRPWTILFGPIVLDDVIVNGTSVLVLVDQDGALYWDPLVDAVAAWFDHFSLSLTSFAVRGFDVERRHVDGRNSLAVTVARADGAIPTVSEFAIEASGIKADLQTALPLRTRQVATLDRVVLGRQEGPHPVTLFATGAIEGDKLVLEAEGGNLLDDERAMHEPVHAQVTLGEAEASLHGAMSADSETHLAFGFKYLEPAAGDHPAIEASGTVSDPGTSWRFDNIEIERGNRQVSGNLLIENSDGRRRVSGNATARHMEYPASEDEPDEGEQESDLGDILPEDVVAELLDTLRQADANLQLNVEDSRILGIQYDSLVLHTRLIAGNLETTVENLASHGAIATGSLTVSQGEDIPQMAFNADMRNIEIANLISGVEALSGVQGQFDGEVSLQAAGKNTQSVLGSTEGQIRLYLDDGQMPEPLAEKFAGEVLSALFADFDKEDTTAIRCARADFSVENGVATSTTMLMDTSEFILKGRGEINLAENTINLNFKPNARDFSLISVRTPFRVRGSLTKPKFDPDISDSVESLLTPIEFGEDRLVSCDPSDGSVTQPGEDREAVADSDQPGS